MEGRPVLLPRGQDVVVSKSNPAVEHQRRQRTGEHRRGWRRLTDAFRQHTTARVFADDQQQVALLVERAAPHWQGGLLVDVGACEQYYRPHLDKLGQVVAMDVSLYSATTVLGDCHQLPFGDGALGGICAVEVLEHLSRPWQFFAEAARTVASGGLLMGVVPQYAPTHGFPYDFFRYTQKGLESLAQDAGFDTLAMWPTGGRFATLFYWYWANYARESRWRQIKGLNLAYHLYFNAMAGLFDRLDRRTGRGLVRRDQEHQDHLGWSFLFRRR